MSDIYEKIKGSPVSEPLKVQTTGCQDDGQEKPKLQYEGMQVLFRDIEI